VRKPSSPLAASGALLVAIAIGSLAARHRALRPPRQAAPIATAPASADLAAAPIDLNRAPAEELERLPRIGPALAARIVAEREAHGAFARIEDLARVRGIGRATIEAIRPLVVVRSDSDRAR
jgi:competence protein ComEA